MMDKQDFFNIYSDETRIALLEQANKYINKELEEIKNRIKEIEKKLYKI
jgi:TRAP-type C4-dicarboxylate transport system substrate-binding protein